MPLLVGLFRHIIQTLWTSSEKKKKDNNKYLAGYCKAYNARETFGAKFGPELVRCYFQKDPEKWSQVSWLDTTRSLKTASYSGLKHMASVCSASYLELHSSLPIFGFFNQSMGQV